MALFRRIVEDYEARLSPPAGADEESADARGKAEHERFGDGEVEFGVRLRGLPVHDGAEVEIHLNGSKLASVPVNDGRAMLLLSLGGGDSIPAVRSEDRIEIIYRGRMLLSGRFAPD